ncbi:MAG: hypothetical protein P1U63_09610 [Coxiellaceae bacterium]|nr:hypothetical protein [Coxiellaceae bacterium]
MRKTGPRGPTAGDAAHPAAMPEAKDTAEQARIVAEMTALDSPPPTAITKRKPANVFEVIPAQDKLRLITLADRRKRTSAVFIDASLINPIVPYGQYQAIEQEKFRHCVNQWETEGIELTLHELNQSDLIVSPIISNAIFRLDTPYIFNKYDADDYRSVTALYPALKEIFGDQLSQPNTLSLLLTSNIINLSDSIATFLFSYRYYKPNWQCENRLHIIDCLEKLLDPFVGQHHRDRQSLDAFNLINRHLTKIPDNVKGKPTRKIIQRGVQHVAAFLFGLGKNATIENAIIRNYTAFMLQQFTINQFERGAQRSTNTCVFVELAALCFAKHPNPYEDYTASSRPATIKFFFKAFKCLPQKKRIAWLGTSKTQTTETATTTFSALYYIALNCSVDEFNRVVDFPLSSQPHLLTEAFKAAMQQNPSLLPCILQDLTPTEILNLMQSTFMQGSRSASENLPTLIHENYRASYDHYEDYEDLYVDRYYANTNACGIKSDNSPAELIILLLNLPIRKLPEHGSIYYWDALLKLCQLPEESNPNVKLQLAICHHYSPEPGVLDGFIESFISIALIPNGELMQLYAEQLLQIAMPIMQHGTRMDQSDTLKQYLLYTVCCFNSTGICDFSLVSKLIDTIDTMSLHSIKDSYKKIPTKFYFDLLVSIKNPAKRLTVFAELYQNAPQGFFNQQTITQCIDLLREDILQTACGDLQKETINSLGKFFHPFASALSVGEIMTSRIDRLCTTSDLGTIILHNPKDDDAAARENVLISRASSTQSDFRQGHLITALSNFKRTRIGWNSFYDTGDDTAPSHQLKDRLFQLPRDASRISDSVATAASDDFNPRASHPD